MKNLDSFSSKKDAFIFSPVGLKALNEAEFTECFIIKEIPAKDLPALTEDEVKNLRKILKGNVLCQN